MPYYNYVNCTSVSPACPVSGTTYGYVPNLGGNVFFCIWFGTLLVLGLVLGLRSRTWTYTLALTIGGILETIGYIGRIILHENVWNTPMFSLNIVGLVLAPSFMAAAVYLTLKHLVLFFGPEHSILKPKLYPWLFVGFDIGSICLQAIGGGLAAAGGSANPNLLNAGDVVIVTGIALQVATMIVFGLLATVYIVRYQRHPRTSAGVSSEEKKSVYAMNHNNPAAKRRVLIFCASVGVAYFLILIRCIYRLPEMAGGWGNPLMQDETEFLILDGTMIAIATLLLTVIHPAFFFREMCHGRKQPAIEQGDLSVSDVTE